MTKDVSLTITVPDCGATVAQAEEWIKYCLCLGDISLDNPLSNEAIEDYIDHSTFTIS